MASALTCVIICATTACLLAMCASDIRRRLVSNDLILFVMALSVCQMIACHALALPVLTFLPGWVERLCWGAGVIAFGALAEFAWRAAHDGCAGMGFGDIKLLGALGLWFGSYVLVVLFVACLICIIPNALARRRTFPFVPYLVAGATVTFILLLWMNSPTLPWA